MLQAPLALSCFLVALVTCGVLAVSRRVAALAGWEGLSAGAYVAWLLGVLAGAIVVLAAVTPGALFGAWVVWSLFLHVGFAIELGASVNRRRAAFLVVYGSLYVVTVYHLGLEGLLDGTAASMKLSFGGQLLVMHAGAPVGSLLGVEAGRAAVHAVGALAAGVFRHLALALAMSTFVCASLALSYLRTERGGVRLGLSLLYAPRWAAMILAALVAGWMALPASGAARPVAGWAVAFLLPFPVAEGLAVVRRMLSRLTTRSIWLGALVAVAVAVPSVAWTLAVLGWATTLLRVDEIRPLLAPPERIARPRLSGVIVGAAAVSGVLLVTGVAERSWLASVSRRLEQPPAICSSVKTGAPGGSAVRYSGTGIDFALDREATALQDTDDPEAACQRRGKRVCRSDEWQLACLCAHANESRGGLKLLTNEALVFRVQRQQRGPGAAEPRALLSGAPEIVGSGSAGDFMVAGTGPALDSSWMTDCRYRGRVDLDTASARAALAVRCCE